MEKWLKYSAGNVVRDRELFLKFKKDYLYIIGTTFSEGCGSCFDKQYNNFINKILNKKTMENTSGYLLKLKYNGISFNGVLYNNADLTKAKARILLKNHPAGKELFDKIPIETKRKSKK